MKKYMVTDLVKDIAEEDKLKSIEDIPDEGSIPFSIGSGEYGKNPDGSYTVTLDFNLGGSAEYIMGPDELFDFLNDPSGSYYNSQIRLS